ncbi:MAG TPA: ABC transporter substrate-binding protein [Hyphomonadaceae bacterium]|nr:ABC transporter substrate-binding protein [Hyphomonadaceae bacterium]
MSALLALAALAVAACARPRADESTLIIALPTFSDSTFLPWTGGGQRKGFLDPIYDYLCIINPETGEPGPGLAESWTTSADGKVWTFSLRKGVQFQRGYGEVTSADVAYSIKQVMSPASRAGPASPLRRLIKSIETPDAYTVIINLNRPDPELAKGYLANAQQVGIVSAKYVGEVGERAANATPVGSGPYQLDFFRRDSEIRLKVREDKANIWREAPQFERLVFLAAPEVSTRVAMLKTGEADIAPMSYDDIDDVRQAGLQVRSIPQSWSPVVRMGGLVQEGARYEAKNPWADVRVRQAMNYAIDKDTIIRRIFHGEGRIAASDTPVEAWADLPPYPYDPAKARQLLTEAGYPDGFTLTLKTFTTNPGAELPTVAQAVALYWRAVGIKVSIELIDWTSLRTAWTSGAARTYVWTHRGFPFTSAQNGLEAGFEAKSLFASYNTPQLQVLIDAHSAELDPAKRRALLTDIGQYLRDQAGNVFIAHINEPYAVSSKVGDWTITSSNALNFEHIVRAPGQAAQ